MKRIVPACALILASCAPAPPRVAAWSCPPCAPERAVGAAADPPPRAPSVPAPLALYLPPEQAAGSPYCFDPDSAELRATLMHPAPKEGDTVDAAALAADVADLHAAMKRLYAGYAELVEDPRFDVDAFFSQWESDVRAAGATITIGDGVIAPLLRLRRAHRDNHLAVRVDGPRLDQRPELAVSEYQHEGIVAIDPACTFAPARPIAGTTRIAKLLARHTLSDVTTFSAQSTEPAIDVTCGAKTTRFARRAAKRIAVDESAPPYEWRAVGDAAVIRVRRFYGSPADLAVLERIARDYDAHRAHRTLVFDFRGNGGGNDEYVYDWIDRAVRGRWVGSYTTLHVVGARAPCGDWNAMVRDQIEYDRVDAADARAERAALMKEKFHVHDAAVQALGSPDEEGHAKQPYAGRVFAIVDRDAGSSGESAPDALRAALHATIVGERSAGFAEYGNVRPWLMPRTGLRWGLASKRNYFDEPRETVGVPVDVYLDDDLLAAPAEEIAPLLARLPLHPKR